jgi:hypothetical protein
MRRRFYFGGNNLICFQAFETITHKNAIANKVTR